jgi:phosphate transport system substrate-binding protein
MKRNHFFMHGLIALSLALVSRTSAADKITMSGSNTMAPIAAAWAEAYEDASVVASGGGTGIGVKQLTDGSIDICNASRPLKAAEKEAIKAKHGKEVVEYHIGYDALAIFTNLANPLKEISVEELKGIYSAEGTIADWSGLPASTMTDKIEVLGRESTSGTYEYFQEETCGKDDKGKLKPFRQGISAMSSSQAIVDTLATTKNAIGYDGMAFKTDKVKWLAVAKKKGDKAVTPGADAARSGEYPLARKLFIYTVGEPKPHVKAFITWLLGVDGQKLVAETGAVPLK